MIAKKLLSLIMFAYATTQATTLHTPDNYVQSFALHSYNHRIEYMNENNTLILYADPSTIVAILKFVCAAACGVGGFTITAAGLTSSHQDGVVMSMLVGIPICLLGAWLGFDALNDMSMQQRGNVPYLTFDNQGLRLFNKRQLYWNDVDHIELRSVVKMNQYGMEESRTRTADFVNPYSTVLFSIGEHNEYLPVSFENLIAIATHYIEQYGSKLTRPSSNLVVTSQCSIVPSRY